MCAAVRVCVHISVCSPSVCEFVLCVSLDGLHVSVFIAECLSAGGFVWRIRVSVGIDL